MDNLETAWTLSLRMDVVCGDHSPDTALILLSTCPSWLFLPPQTHLSRFTAFIVEEGGWNMGEKESGRSGRTTDGDSVPWHHLVGLWRVMGGSRNPVERERSGEGIHSLGREKGDTG